MLVILIVAVCAIVGVGYSAITHTHDSPIEEVAEEIIEKELNLPAGSVDLSPGTPEPRRKQAKN